MGVIGQDLGVQAFLFRLVVWLEKEINSMLQFCAKSTLACLKYVLTRYGQLSRDRAALGCPGIYRGGHVISARGTHNHTHAPQSCADSQDRAAGIVSEA